MAINGNPDSAFVVTVRNRRGKGDIVHENRFGLRPVTLWSIADALEVSQFQSLDPKTPL